ncbi:centrosome-associated protein 350 isoform X2 [Paroedura picta]|uniref:centrosome-associated protein 350 isoform X2 n=1 Tax=Paroedura picta TaxID=143630 RepID=UPI00405766B2
MWSNKQNEVPLQNPRSSLNRDSIRDLTTAWDAFSQTKAALRHIENKLEVAPTSTAVLDSVMDAKKPSASTTRKISRKACRSSSQKKERSSRYPLRATTLDSNVKKSGHVEFHEPLASFRDIQWSSSSKTSCKLDGICLKREAGNKTEEISHMTYEKDEPDLQNRDFKSLSSVDETVVRYLNDRPAIDALQNSDPFFKTVTPTRSEEEKTEGSRDEYIKTSLSTTAPDAELKDPQLAESSTSSTTTSSAHRLDILKRHQHDAKLEKLKERIRKQWEFQEELNSRGQFRDYVDHPLIVAPAENTVTPKVRKVAAAPPAPSYKGFNPSEAKIRTPDGKVWREEEFLNLSRELCRDLTLQLEEDDSAVKDMPAEKIKERKATKTVRKVQKVAELPGPDSKPGGMNIISVSSWRDGQRLAKKVLGPPPKLQPQDKQSSSAERTGRDRSTKSASHFAKTESDPMRDVAIKPCSRSPKRSQSKMRRENSLRKRDAALKNTKQKEDHVNKDFLPVEIQGILDDLQLDSVAQHTKQEMGEENQISEAPTAFTRSHSPTKRKPDKLGTNEESQVTSKKRHYDTDEVRQYIIKQQEERKKKQSEQKKAQKEATEQRNKRLQELYRKQREALSSKPKSASAPELVPKQLQETYSRLFLDQALLEDPQLPLKQDVQPKPGYQPSGESDKENKAQERPPSASSSSDMSLSEPHHTLARNNLLEPVWIQPDRLSSKSQPLCPQPVLSGGLFSQLLSLDHMSVLQKDFDSILSTRRSHLTAMGSMPLASPSVTTSTIQPTINQYKSKLDRIEALKATAASLSSRIESEAKKLAGTGIDYGAAWNSGHDLVQGSQGDGYWAKASSPPVREENDVFSARLQEMLSTCVCQTTFEENLPGVGNLSEFKKLPETISPHTAALSLPCKPRSEGIVGSLSKKPSCFPKVENKVVALEDSSIDSISEGPLSDHLLSEEEEGDRHECLPLKAAELLKEKEFCAADKTGYEPIEQFQKEAEKYLPISTQTRSVSRPWEGLTKGSPHSVINIFTKSYQLCGKGFEEQSGPGSPIQQPSLPLVSPPASIVSYEDDFISSQGSGMVTDKKSAAEPSVHSSSPSLKEEIISRNSPYEVQAKEFTHHSSGSPSASSSCSSASSKRRGKKERLESFPGASHGSLREESKTSAESDHRLSQTKSSVPSSGLSRREQGQNPDSDNTLEELSGQSLMSLPDKLRSPRTASSPQSPNGPKQLDPAPEKTRSSSSPPTSIAPASKPNLAFSGTSRTGAGIVNGAMRFSPAGLHQRMSAEINYLCTIEESVRQLSDMERVRGITLAQQESVSLAQILKAQQQRHERDLALLKIKAEQEALESQRQLEETRQKAAQAHAESLQQLVQSRQEAAEALQETTCKIAAQQVEAALLTTDAARQIREMTELARAQISDVISVPAAPVTMLLDQERKHHSSFIKKIKSHSDSSRKTESVTPSPDKEEAGDSKHHYSPSFDSYSESSRSKAHDQSSSSRQESPPVPFSKEAKKASRREKSNSSIEEEVLTAVNDSLKSNSIPSIADERDSTSVATEYSLKFDESMTEDEIEEKSFRSLLPSESHRRINLKKRGHHEYSDEEASPGKPPLSPVKELSLPFSGGQDSFSKFTMEMVRQYMKEEEMRAAHQSSLLRLREKALKEKTKAELAWLEHQKKRLRDKGEDDKMPPIRKKQRGLIMKLQQEKAEIKRLQEANKAARKERQLILKQQEEIERIRQTTMKLQEKLKSAGENKLEHRSEDDTKQTHSSSPLPTDAETCSPSSVSSSETSSIMQKLKKMRSRMDEKHCSPVHYFFSVFTSHHWASLSVCFPNLHPKFQLYIYNQLVRFLTKREQKLMQRRQHAEELLQWKRRLDAEEAEIRQIEKQALAAWNKELLETKANKMAAGDQNDQKETASEEDSSVPPCSRFNSGSSVPEELGRQTVESGPSKVSEVQEQLGSPDHTTLLEEMVYTQELESSASPGRLSPSKCSTSLSKPGSSKGTHRTGGQQHLPVKSQEVSYSWSDESLSMTQSETTSDQSDIESRIRALKDELRKRKSVVYQLKKEQKKRHKERLKAQEASLIKQLETYDEFIKKTEAELSQDLETAPTAKPQIKTPSSVTEKPKIKPPPLHRSETTKSWKSLTDSERCRGSLESIAEHIDAVSRSERSDSSYAKKFVEAEARTGDHFEAPSLDLKPPQKAGAESDDLLDHLLPSAVLKDLGDLSKTSHVSLNISDDATSCDTLVSTNRSVEPEEVVSVKLEDSEPNETHKLPGRPSASVLDPEQKSSPLVSLKTSACPEISSAAPYSVQDGKEIPKQEESYKDEDCAASGQSFQKLDKTLLLEQPSAGTEPLVSNGFERRSRKHGSDDGAGHTEYDDDFDTSASSFGKHSRSQGEKSFYTKTPRSRSASIGSDEEVSECLSDKAQSVASSVHSERLLILRSPTELMKNKERSDVEGESSRLDASLQVCSPEVEEGEGTLQGFRIGDRVLVSNVQPGTLRFKGLTSFAKGFWAGVELDKPEGRNDGTYDGIKYFDCKEKHGIFAPPQKISLIPESSGDLMDSEEHCKITLDLNRKADQEDRESAREEEGKSEGESGVSEKSLQERSQRGASALEGSIAAGDYLERDSPQSQMVAAVEEKLAEEQSVVNSLRASGDDPRLLAASISDVLSKTSPVPAEGALDGIIPDTWKQQQPSWQEYTEKSESLSPGVLETSATPLLDLLTKERSQLEAQLRLPSHKEEEEEPRDQQEKVGLLTDSLLQAFVKDTVSQLQQIRKVRNEKIQCSNQELAAAQEQKLAAGDLQSILISSQLDDGEEVSSPDLCPRPESPVFGASGQEELAKRLAELELSREFLSVLGDDQDWFDEDFGLSTRKLPPKQAEESAVLPKIEPPKVPPKPCEEPLAVPHTAEEVEDLVHEAAEELWKCKELGCDLEAAGFPRDLSDSLKDDDIEAISKQIYKQAVFDLTREIFGEIFAEDPNLNQPIWMKPCRITSTYFRRVKDPSDIEEIKSFIATEVLKLLNLKKEPNNKMDWQKMIKFGRKKRDRVDHILVQELHEEEAQWVNYDEDELYVKMQLADGIFEALIRETIDVLNQINEKQERLLPM